MKGKFLPLLAAAALMMGVTSCNNDDDAINNGTIQHGQQTAMGLSISMPRAPKTYAADDVNATDAEIEMKKVTVLIYSETAAGSGVYLLETPVNLVRTDFEATPVNPDTYVLKSASKITTTAGNKKIFVAMNYSGTLPATNSNLTALPSVIHNLSSATELSSAGLAMFSYEAKDATLVVQATPGVTPAANVVTITVKRMVAKVTVQENITRTAGKIISQGGELTNLQFALGNLNKSIFPLQKRVGTSPSIVVQDNNWSSFAAGNFFGISSYALASAEYFSIDDMTKTALTAKALYCPENTAQNYDVDGKNLTYISVRAQYAPEFFVDATGANIGAKAAGTSFWTVVKADGTVMYFDNSADATTYQAANAGSSAVSAEYVSGLCYFRAYINKNGMPDGNIAGSVAAKFDVLRNNYYAATISSIKAPGRPVDEGKVTETTTLECEIEVEPLYKVTDNYDL